LIFPYNFFDFLTLLADFVNFKCAPDIDAPKLKGVAGISSSGVARLFQPIVRRGMAVLT
jgi:hypothetical protein